MKRLIPHRPAPRAAWTLATAWAAIAWMVLLASPLAAQDPAAARLLRESERLLQGGNPEAALEELELLVQQFPNDQLAPAAMLRVAELQRAKGAQDKATAVLDRLIENHGRSSEAALAMLQKAELTLGQASTTTQLQDARTAVRRVPLLFGRDAYPILEARRRARTVSGEICLLLGEAPDAAADFVAAIEDEPPSPAIGRAQLGLARAWLMIDERAAATEVLERLKNADDTLTDPVSRQGAADLLSLVHRRYLRPASGQDHWLSTSRYPASGLALREPAGVAAAEDGRVLVVDPRLPLAAIILPDGSVGDRSNLRDTERPGFDAQGNPFIASENGILVPWGGRIRNLTDPRRGSPLKNLIAAAHGAFGDLYVVARGAKSLLHFPAGAGGRELLADRRPEFVDVARDRQGRIYALDERGRSVLRLNRDGALEGSAAGSAAWKKPAAVDVDALGFIYVLDRSLRRVELYSPGGQLLAAKGPNMGGGIELRSPEDLAVDGRGRVFIADSKLPFLVMLD